MSFKVLPTNCHTYPLRKKFRAMGGEWDKTGKAWRIPEHRYDEAMRMVEEVTPEPKAPLDPRLIAAQEKVGAAQATLSWARSELNQVLLDVVSSAPEVYGIPPHALSFGFHDCDTSPTGACVYDGAEDPCRDCCLFCEDPEERK
jgi:hypothetical protein